MYRIDPIVDKIGRRALHGLARSAPEGIIGKARGEAGVTDPGELVSSIPCIGRRDSCIGHRDQIPVEIIGLGVGTERRLLIIGVVARGRERRRQPTPGERSTRLDPIPRRIIGIEQRAQGGRAFLIRQGRQFGGSVLVKEE